MKEKFELNIPFQIQQLITGMNDKSNGDHIRSNYRSTLENIRKTIDDHCEKFDNEMGAYNMRGKR